MYFELIPVAEASVVTLMKSINRVVINPIIIFLFALALVYFLFGVAQYFLNPDNENIRKSSKNHMLYGVIGLFVMIAVFGIMNLILNTVGERRIKIQNTGDYEILKTGNDEDNFEQITDDSTQIELTSGTEDLSYSYGTKIETNDFKSNPFKAEYIENEFCWHKQFSAEGDTEYKALKAVKEKAKSTYMIDNNIKVETKVLPLNYGTLTAYDKVNGKYYTWMDARAPIGGGKINDCVLPIKNIKELKFEDYVFGNRYTELTSASTGPSLFTTSYTSDDLFYRVQGSGVNYLLQEAREIAIKNDYFLLFHEYLDIDINSMTVVYPTFRILEEKYIFKDGQYEYWVAIESAKDSGTLKDYVVLKPVSFKSPFTTQYNSNLYFTRLIDLGKSKDPIEAKKVAISNALLKLSLGVCNDDKDNDNDGVKDISDPNCHTDNNAGNPETYIPYHYSESIIPKLDPSSEIPISLGLCNDKLDNDNDSLKDFYDPNCHLDNNAKNIDSYVPYHWSESATPKIDTSAGVQFVIILEEKQIYNQKTGEYEYWVAVGGSRITPGSKPISQSLKAIPFTKVYKSDATYFRAVDSGVSKDLSTAKELAMNNALIKISNEAGNALTGTQMVNILEEKQVFNSITGFYEYWVSIEVEKSTTAVDNSTAVNNSTTASPFTKTYSTDDLYYRVVDSATSKSLSTAKDMARNNAFQELASQVSSGTFNPKLVTTLEEKQIYNSETGEYEYWVAMEMKK